MAYADMMSGAIARKKPVAKAAPAVSFGDTNAMRAAAEDQYAGEAATGSQATSAYLAKANAFDPQAALNTYAQGAWGSISAALKNQLTETRGQAVGAGRYDSGFLDEDTGTVINKATDQFSQQVAQQSLNAAALGQKNTAEMGQFGQNQTSDANEMLASEREFKYNQDEQKKKDKRAKWGAIGSVVGGLAGAATGNPQAATIGAQLGGSLGGFF